jgi:hypothetical protein
VAQRPSSYHVLGVGQLSIVEVHVALSRPDIRVPEQPAGVFDFLLAADFRS